MLSRFVSFLLVGLFLLPTLPSDFEARMMSEMQAQDIDGVVVLMVDGDEIVYLEGLGTDQNGDPFDTDAAFNIGRMADLFTASLAMIQAESGMIAPETPVKNLLPSLRLSDDSVSSGTTIARLLNHSTGIIDTDPARPPMTPLSLSEPLSNFYFPGERYSYCAICYGLMVTLLENRSHESLPNLLHDTILEPLLMDNTTLEDGYIYTTPSDLARLMSVQLQGGRWHGIQLMKPESVHSMQSTWRETGGGDNEFTGYAWLVKSEIGLDVRDPLQNRLVTIRDNGDYTAQMTLIPHYGQGVFLLTDQAANGEALDALMAIALEALTGWTAPPTQTPARLIALTGNFRSSQTYSTFPALISTTLDGEQILVSLDGGDPQPAAFVDEHTLTFSGDEGARRVRLYFDPAGRTVTLTRDQVTMMYQRQYQ